MLRSRSRPEPYFLAGAGAEIISYFRLRLQKIPYKNDFITTIFFSDHGIFITNIFKNNSYLLTLTSIFSIQPSKILYKRRHSLDTTDPAAFFKFKVQVSEERLFSSLKIFKSDRRSRLKEDILNALLFLKSNM